MDWFTSQALSTHRLATIVTSKMRENHHVEAIRLLGHATLRGIPISESDLILLERLFDEHQDAVGRELKRWSNAIRTLKYLNSQEAIELIQQSLGLWLGILALQQLKLGGILLEAIAELDQLLLDAPWMRHLRESRLKK